MPVVDHVPNDITINPSMLAPGDSAQCTVTLTGPTGVAGTVGLTTSAPGDFVNFPSSVSFNAGESSASVTVQTSTTASGNPILSASANGATVHVVASISA